MKRRNLDFVRYADDVNVFVRSERAGARVRESLTRFIEQRLRLKVNEEKTVVALSKQVHILGFSLMRSRKSGRTEILLSSRSKQRIRAKIIQALHQVGSKRFLRLGCTSAPQDSGHHYKAAKATGDFVQAPHENGSEQGHRRTSSFWQSWHLGEKQSASPSAGLPDQMVYGKAHLFVDHVESCPYSSYGTGLGPTAARPMRNHSEEPDVRPTSPVL